MTLDVTFGNGGVNGKYTVDSRPDIYGNGGTIHEAATESGAGTEFEETSVYVGRVSVPGSGLGGTVDVSFDDGSFVFDVTGVWNSVKNVSAVSDEAENVKFTDFVQVEVDFSAATGGSSVEIENAKRGFIETGSGNDSILISTATNNEGWLNAFEVTTGAGNDSIVFTAGTGSGLAGITNGAYTSVVIDAGDGTDTIDLSGVDLLSAIITGGAGVDSITCSAGTDTLVYGVVAGGNGSDTIYNFDATEDTLDLRDGVTVSDQTAFGGDYLVSLSDGSLLVFEGLTSLDAGVFV